MLDELATVSEMTLRKLENEREARQLLPEVFVELRSSTLLIGLTQESLDTIVRLENTLKLERLKGESLVKEKRLLEHQLKVQEKEIAKLSEELDLLKTETGWTRGTRLNVPRCSANAVVRLHFPGPTKVYHCLF